MRGERCCVSDLELMMVPSGELHITAVDYRHTHHPYFCIVKDRTTGASQESLPFHLTLRDTMSYSKPEQMNDQEFYISVEQGNVALQERWTGQLVAAGLAVGGYRDSRRHRQWPQTVQLRRAVRTCWKGSLPNWPK